MDDGFLSRGEFWRRCICLSLLINCQGPSSKIAMRIAQRLIRKRDQAL